MDQRDRFHYTDGTNQSCDTWVARMAQSLVTDFASAHKMSICRSAISLKIADAGRSVLQ